MYIAKENFKVALMSTATLLTFQNLEAAVSLEVDQRFLDALPLVFLNWPYELLSISDRPVFASVSYKEKRYTISSPFMDAPVSFSDPVNAICSLIVELAWAHLRADPALLCLHGAAVEINGRLVVFPNARRAGKSTLAVAMLAAGYRLFTDDFLPLRIDGENRICGVAQGIAPRLRLPFPDQIGARAATYIDQHTCVANRQYQYVIPAGGELAKFGVALPLGAVVFLERQEEKAPTLTPVDQSETLKNLLTQNFSRAMNSDGILEILAALATNTPAYVMNYSDVESAIEMLDNTFGCWQADPAVVVNGRALAFGQAGDIVPDEQLNNWGEAILEQASGIKEIAIENKRFLSDPSGRNIHFLNAGATNIWRILENPANIVEIVDILATAFPDHAVGEIRQDVNATIQKFAENGLVQCSVIEDVENQISDNNTVECGG